MLMNLGQKTAKQFSENSWAKMQTKFLGTKRLLALD
jgi:hypothetical protein